MQNLMQVLEFVGRDGNHFLGTVIVLLIFFAGTSEVIRALRGVERVEDEE